MFKDLKPEIKLFVLVALIAVVISIAGILLLRTLQPPSTGEQVGVFDTEEVYTFLTIKVLDDKDVFNILNSFADQEEYLKIEDFGEKDLLKDAVQKGNRDIKNRIKEARDKFEVRYSEGVEDSPGAREAFLIYTKLCIAESIISNDLQRTTEICGVPENQSPDDITASMQVLPYFVAGMAYYTDGNRERADYYFSKITSHKKAITEPYGEESLNTAGEVYKMILDKVEKLSASDLSIPSMSDWQTYRNAKYGFEIKYPEEFEVHAGGPTQDSSDRLNFRAIDICKDWGWSGDYSSVLRWTVGENYSRNEMVIAGHEAIVHSYYDYEYEIKKNNCVSLIFTLSSRSPGVASEPTVEQKGLFDQILATFRFAEEDEIASWTDCVDESAGEGIPVVTSVMPDSGPVGTELEIRGCNFSGFEGDLNAWIKNNQGKSGILYGSEGSTSKFIKVTLGSSLCRGDNSYSGLPCKEWLALSPGTYKIYVVTWGQTSNAVNFTITQ